jgi:CubicO group peptidase (beta-lactamase class C family)
MRRDRVTLPCLWRLVAVTTAGIPLASAGAQHDCAPQAARPTSPAIERRIHEVEQNVAWALHRVVDLRSATLRERMAHYRVHGIGIAVIHNFAIEWARSYGWADVEHKRPMTSTTRLQPGSISKAVNAFGVMRLVDAGRLDLTSDVNRWLRQWRFPYGLLSKGRPITLGTLLSHTAGLSTHGFWGYAPHDPLPTVPQLLDGQPPATSEPVRSRFPAGVRAEYSGGGTMISQQVLHDATQQPYDALMADEVFGPLGMGCSFFTQPPPASLTAELATGYNALGAPIRGGHAVMPEQAAAGLWTTPTDLARFVIGVQLAIAGAPGARLSPLNARRMITPVLRGAPGMGFFVIDTGGVRYFSHGAANSGFSGELIGSARGGNGVVVLQNGESPALTREIIQTVARVYRWPGFERLPDRVRSTIRVPASQVARIAGIYREGDSFVELEARGDTLWYRVNGTRWVAHFSAPDRFFSVESLTDKVLQFDRSGRVIGFRRLMHGSVVGRAHRVGEVVLSPEVRQRYAGSYLDRRGNRWDVSSDASGLRIASDRASRRMRFINATRFFTAEDPDVVWHMVPGRRGPAIGVSMDMGIGAETAYRVPQ